MTKNCGCCEGISFETPEPINVPPRAADSIPYRLGHHATFFESMQAGLTNAPFASGATLRTRDRSDPAIALFDAAACVLDVLAFYQERQANESYLRSATEARSLWEFARSTGYQPRPSIAAQAVFALQVDEQLTLSPGIEVQSTGAKPQVFETVESVVARQEWNQVRPAAVRSTPLTYGEFRTQSVNQLYFAGVDTGLRPNTTLLIEFTGSSARTLLTRVRDLETLDTGQTVATIQPVTFTHSGAANDTTDDGFLLMKVWAFRNRANLFGCAAPLIPRLHGTSVVRYDEWDFTRQVGQKRKITLIVKIHGSSPQPPDVMTPAAPPTWRLFVDVGTDPTRLTPDADPAGYPVDPPPTAPFPTDQIEWAAQLGYSTPGVPGGVLTLHVAIAAFPGEPIKTLLINISKTLETTIDADATPVNVSFEHIGDPSVQVNETRDIITDPMTRVTTLTIVGTIYKTGTHAENRKYFDLDAVYPEMTANTPYALDGLDKNGNRLVLVERAADVLDSARADYGISGKCTRIVRPDSGNGYDWFPPPANDSDQFRRSIRESVVCLQAEELVSVNPPIVDNVLIRTSGIIENLYWQQNHYPFVDSQRILIEYSRAPQQVSRFLATVEKYDPKLKNGQLTVIFETPPDTTIIADRAAVTFSANLVKGLQGRTVRGGVQLNGVSQGMQVGRGDPTRASQQFPLLTGGEPVLFDTAGLDFACSARVAVGDRPWNEIDSLSLAGPNDAVYEVSRAVDQSVAVSFGDGVHGARLSNDPVTVTYRTGEGGLGNIAAGLINQVSLKPQGLQSMSNPFPAAGGAAADSTDQLRKLIPFAAKRIDRIVSVRDFEAAALQWPGIAAAKAAWAAGTVELWIAGIDQKPVDPLLITKLQQTLSEQSASRSVTVKASVPVPVTIEFTVWVQSGAADALKAAIADRIAGLFSFDKAGFSSWIDSAEALALTAIQALPGVARVEAFTATPKVAGTGRHLWFEATRINLKP